MNKTVLSVIGGIITMIIIVAIVIVTKVVGYGNQAVLLENQFTAQKQNNTVVYDKVWKVLQQKAGITSKYAADFKGVYTALMDGRYKGKNPAFNWIKEQNPNFDAAMYKDLSNSVESLRNEFAHNQKRLISIKQEHDNLRKLFPSSLVVGSRTELVLDLVTSTKTKAVFESGEENNVELFK